MKVVKNCKYRMMRTLNYNALSYNTLSYNAHHRSEKYRIFRVSVFKMNWRYHGYNIVKGRKYEYTDIIEMDSTFYA